MNPYDIPDRPIPSWVDNYDDSKIQSQNKAVC